MVQVTVPRDDPANKAAVAAVGPHATTLWFKVVVATGVSGVTNLGRWSGCSGLTVTFDAERIKEGGNYGGEVVLPDRIGYGDVTLERAMTLTQSREVRSWLAAVSRTWLGGQGANQWNREGSTATITVFSGPDHEQEVATWVLRNVMPVSWSAPALTTTGGAVAVEKLVLAHDGFLSADQGGGPPLALKLTDQTGASVEFPYPPDSVRIDHAVVLENTSQNQMMYDPKMTKPGETGISVSDLYLDGVDKVQADVDRLFSWLRPVTAPGAASADDFRPQNLRLRLGTTGQGLCRDVVARSIDVTYVRFDPDGRPSRAKVTLSMQDVGTGTTTAAGGTSAQEPPTGGHDDPIRRSRQGAGA